MLLPHHNLTAKLFFFYEQRFHCSLPKKSDHVTSVTYPEYIQVVWWTRDQIYEDLYYKIIPLL